MKNLSNSTGRACLACGREVRQVNGLWIHVELDGTHQAKPECPKAWNVGEPGGPAGPFYSVVTPEGHIIALQVPERDMAEKIASIPQFNEILAGCLENGTKGPDWLWAWFINTSPAIQEIIGAGQEESDGQD